MWEALDLLSLGLFAIAALIIFEVLSPPRGDANSGTVVVSSTAQSNPISSHVGGAPANGGFSNTPGYVGATVVVLSTGLRLDRFGGDNGTYFSPAGDQFDKRSLQFGCHDRPYSIYEVREPIVALAGGVAPAHGKPGGGIQFVTRDPVTKLIAEGEITRVPAPPGQVLPC